MTTNPTCPCSEIAQIPSLMADGFGAIREALAIAGDLPASLGRPLWPHLKPLRETALPAHDLLSAGTRAALHRLADHAARLDPETIPRDLYDEETGDLVYRADRRMATIVEQAHLALAISHRVEDLIAAGRILRLRIGPDTEQA